MIEYLHRSALNEWFEFKLIKEKINLDYIASDNFTACS